MSVIAVHMHPQTNQALEGMRPVLEKMAPSIGAETALLQPYPIEDAIEDMEAAGIDKAILLAFDSRTYSGAYVSNDYVANLERQFPDRFIGFASVDPHMGLIAVEELDRAIKELGLHGLKLDPTKQNFCPSDRMAYPLYEKCVELDIPIIFHTGHSPGFPIQWGNPEYIDRVAQDFPKLRMTMAHFGWPWHDLALAIAWDRPNVYIDIADWRPKYIPPQVVQFMNSTLQHKTLFSHGYPIIRATKMMPEWEQLPLSPEARKLIMEENPVKFLGHK